LQANTNSRATWSLSSRRALRTALLATVAAFAATFAVTGTAWASGVNDETGPCQSNCGTTSATYGDQHTATSVNKLQDSGTSICDGWPAGDLKTKCAAYPLIWSNPYVRTSPWFASWGQDEAKLSGSVYIMCQFLTGQPVAGDRVWDRIVYTIDSGNTKYWGWVTDDWVNTGTMGQVTGIPACDTTVVPTNGAF
jgi:hypothetical protein